MRKTLLLALLSAGAFVAIAAVPAALFEPETSGVSASAKGRKSQSQENLPDDNSPTAFISMRSQSGHMS